MSAVQHSPGEVVKPELGQRRENDGEISPTVAGKESGYVFKEEPSSVPNKFIGESGELEEEARALSSFKAGPLAGDAEVLAGESSAEEADLRDLFVELSLAGEGADIFVDGDFGPVASEDAAAGAVGLALEDDARSGALEAEVESPDSAEQTADGERLKCSSLVDARDLAR